MTRPRNPSRISRRRFLVAAGGAGVLGRAGLSGAQDRVDRLEEQARREAAAQEAIRALTGGAAVRVGRVKLDLPPLIDNGNTVPLTVTVESPMTRADHVRSIHVFARRNPQPLVFDAFLGPRAGRAMVSTRARIADTQTLTAIARMADGSFWSGSMDVIVTLSACLEEGLV